MRIFLLWSVRIFDILAPASTYTLDKGRNRGRPLAVWHYIILVLYRLLSCFPHSWVLIVVLDHLVFIFWAIATSFKVTVIVHVPICFLLCLLHNEFHLLPRTHSSQLVIADLIIVSVNCSLGIHNLTKVWRGLICHFN